MNSCDCDSFQTTVSSKLFEPEGYNISLLVTHLTVYLAAKH